MKQKRQQQNPEQKITTLEKELVLKSRELKIETALEKVRNKAMRMKKPDDMLDVCKTISLQLKLLGVKEIRNVQTAIFYEQRGTYMNYEYYAKHNKTIITETSYTNHKMHKAFASKMLKGKGEFFVTHIKDKKVKDWIAYQKTTNVFIDKYLKTASSLNYYWFSLGPVALGISTYIPLIQEEIIIFKRFLKVFELAYRRYLDIEKAVAQVREAHIEASLERVRAQAMGMNKPADLLNICEILFKEFQKLGFDEMRNAMINIHNDDKKTFLNYDYSDEIGKSVTLLNFNSHPVMEKQINQSRMANDAFSEAVYRGKDLEAWKEFRRKYGEKDDPRIKNITALYYYFYSIGNGTIGISTFSPVNEEKLELLKRFRNVFSLSYQRYSDIALAEAQAKESRIQLALERVRARTMAMHHSDELAETAYVLFQQFKEIDKEPKMITIGIMNENENVIEFWVTDWSGGGSKINQKFHGSIDEPTILNKLYKAWENGSRSIVVELVGKNLQKWVDYRVKISGIPDDKDYSNEKGFVVAAFFSNGILSFSIYEPVSPETIELLERFAGVFDITYTRFLDLQRAEAQAREAQIQLALERVRARTMAMQRSVELAETVLILFKQLLDLDVQSSQLRTCGIVTFKENKPQGEIWITDITGEIIADSFIAPYDEAPTYKAIYSKWKNGEKFLEINLKGDELLEHLKFVKNYSAVPNIDIDEIQKSISEIFFHVMFYSQGYLFIISYEPLSEFHEIFNRFGSVFQQAYTRFLDLQKAEAQAREAKIEAALEKVRAVAMSMNKPDDLLNICEVSFKEFQKLGFDNLRNAVIHILNDEKRFFMDYDYSDYFGGNIVSINYNSHPVVENYLQQIKKADDAFAEVIVKGIELDSWKDFRRSRGQYDDLRLEGISALHYYLYSIGVGDIGISTFGPIDESQIKILKRFRNVFDLSYRRYSDIALAEAQAKEAEIELALERVRARTMAMQKSEELKEVIKIVFQQLTHLKINLDHSGFVVDYTPRGDWHFWVADEREIPSKITHPYFESVWANQFDEAKEKGVDFFTTNLNFEEKNKFYNELLSYVPGLPEESKDFYLSCPGLAATTVLMDNVGLYIENFSGIPYTDEENNTLMRFGKVFQQTYTRFLDLQKAEAQAREAQIEAALEKVRSKAMAMHSSENLSETIVAFYHELEFLHITPRRCGVGIVNKETRVVELSSMNSTELGKSLEIIGRIKLAGHPVLSGVWENWLLQKEYHPVLRGEEINEYYNFLSQQIKYPDYSHDAVQYGYYFFFQEGGTYVWTEEELSEEVLKIYRRFTSVLSLTYKRYKELKEAEAQAREAKIETALERVRSRTMAMQNSNELLDVITVVSEQLKHLGFRFDHVSFAVNSQVHDYNFWISFFDNPRPYNIFVPYLENPMFERAKKAQQEGLSFYSDVLTPEENQQWHKHVFAHNNFDFLNEKLKQFIYKSGFARSIAFLPNIMLIIGNYSSRPYSEEENKIISRFAVVFEQSYTRFLDLQKAEAQTREAQVELALERVRASALAMHNSNDVGNATAVMFTELEKLGIETIRCGIDIMDKSKIFEVWASASSDEGKIIQIIGKLDSRIHPHLQHVQEAWERQDKFISSILEGQELENYYKELSTAPDYHVPVTRVQSNKQFNYDFFFKEGGLFAYRLQPFTEEEIMILQRFTSVFGLTFRRYLDLKKAELQAREAQIEASLERVRSSAMAMHNSNDISSTTTSVFEELGKLNVKSKRCGIALLSGNSYMGYVYAAATSSDGKFLTLRRSIDMTQHQSLQRQYESWKKQENYFIEMNGEELRSYYQLPFFYSSPDYVPPANYEQTEYGYYISFSEGLFYAWTDEPYSENEINILNRFKTIIDLTFRRYLELQNAEAQTREAKIEASLERVRARAMAMHNSEDLSETVNVFFKELKVLGVTPIRCGVGQIDEETRTTSLTTTTSSQQGDSFQVIGKIKQTGHPVLDGIFDHWKMQKEYHPVLEGDDIRAYYSVMNPQIGFPDYPEGVTQYGNCFYFKEGFVFAWTENKLSEEELQIFRRFTSVLSLTYRRYLDLKEAEARAFEAVRQASLDRVRAEIASMRTSEDLNRITPIIWRELKNLDVPFFRCGVYIIDETQEKVRVYLTTPDGKSLGVLHLSFDSNEITNNTVEHWRKNLVYKEHWNKEEFIKWTKSLIEIGQIQNAETYQGSTEPPESLDLHFVPFTQGMLYVGDTSPLNEEKLRLVKTLAEAFSIAYARYEDFKNLEDAKNKIELTLSELKSAQAQLIHSEKMASLGELTAGIAHEIKNPLNFVNNFSEVSRELLDEMKVEIQNNNIKEVIELVEDLKQNLEKITQHGKRADSIVKGMLLHSRGTSGEKTLTDINDLLDQYVTLAYHGMRAQNKEFNITIEKDYDETLEKVSVVPQDISRVFLNIINNACYAAFDRKKKGENKFSPTLKVSTKKLNDKVEISIGDNGNGIPADHLDKIFQPFFTTKPTGEGTGLGLSLSYDIVTKVHGGELKVETKEGQGTEFIIILNN